MTAKRFFKDGNEIVTWIRDKENWKKLKTDDEIVELLNELHEENQELKQEMGNLGTAHAEEINKIEDKFDEEILKLEKENEQLKEQLSEAKTDEKQLGISFMGYKMKLIEVLQKKYDKVKGKTLYAYVYTEIAEEMGIDLE